MYGNEHDSGYAVFKFDSSDFEIDKKNITEELNKCYKLCDERDVDFDQVLGEAIAVCLNSPQDALHNYGGEFYVDNIRHNATDWITFDAEYKKLYNSDLVDLSEEEFKDLIFKLKDIASSVYESVVHTIDSYIEYY